MSRRKPWNESKASRRHRTHRLLIRKKYLICTEGATEALYLAHFKTSTGPNLVILDESDNKLALVKRAIQRRESAKASGDYLEGDVLWVVMDRDVAPSNPKDKQIFNEAVRLAHQENVNLALSCDSFELWFLLHFQEVSSGMHRRDLDAKLTQHLGRTYKSRHSGVEDIYDIIAPNLPDALKRATALERRYGRVSGTMLEGVNPYTSVHHLIGLLMAEKGFKKS